MKRYLFILLVFIISFCNSAYSQTVTLSDSARVSILTNNPWGGAIYALFGHASIRVQDRENNIDIVFNYGVFNFDSSNFIYRFVKGETDYMVVGYDFKYFLPEYEFNNISVYEQVLNLPKEEVQSIWDALCINSLPQNRVYRYNFLFDNCATRLRDIVEKNIHGKIEYNPTNKNQTFRDLLHECLEEEPWTKFGIDLIIGSGADREATDSEKMFLPLYLRFEYDKAQIITSNGEKHQLIDSQKYLLNYNKKFDLSSLTATSIFMQPIVIGCFILLISIALSVFNLRKKGILVGKLFDTLLFLVYGLAGCIITFLMFFSEHPCVDANWNLVWLNPIQFIFAFLFFSKTLSRCVYCYHFINFALLSLFLICWMLIPQDLEIAFIPFIAAMICRSGTKFVTLKRSEQYNAK